jgi:hypothetical protein
MNDERLIGWLPLVVPLLAVLLVFSAYVIWALVV